MKGVIYIFSQFVACLFIFLTGLPQSQSYNSNNVQFISFFQIMLLVLHLRLCLALDAEYFLLIFFLQVLQLYATQFKYMILFELSFVLGIRSRFFFLACQYSIVPAPFVKRLSFLQLIAFTCFSKFIWAYVSVCFSVFYFVPLMCVCIILPILHCLDCCSDMS